MNHIQPENNDSLSRSYALRGMNVGCSLKLRGKVVLVVFFVDDAKSQWDDAAEKLYLAILKKVCLRLMEESGLPKEQLQITYATARASVPYEVNIRTMERLMHDVLQTYDCQDSQQFQQLYERARNRDEACISFVLNRHFRSFAQRIISSPKVSPTPKPMGDEYSIVSFRQYNPRLSERSLIHELMHQFGAMDYYTPAPIAQAARQYLPDSIMNRGNKIDPLTRYVIGWDDTLSDAALKFLKAIEDVPMNGYKGSMNPTDP